MQDEILWELLVFPVAAGVTRHEEVKKEEGATAAQGRPPSAKPGSQESESHPVGTRLQNCVTSVIEQS